MLTSHKMENSHQKATRMIIELQNKNAELRMGLGKLLKICQDTNMQDESEIWAQQIGFAKQIYIETDANKKNPG